MSDPTNLFCDLVASFAQEDDPDLEAKLVGIAASGVEPVAIAVAGALVAAFLAETLADQTGADVGEIIAAARNVCATDPDA